MSRDLYEINIGRVGKVISEVCSPSSPTGSRRSNERGDEQRGRSGHQRVRICARRARRVAGRNRVPFPWEGSRPRAPPRRKSENAKPDVYKFVDTGETIEVQQSFNNASLTVAPRPADGTMRKVKKVFIPVGITFKSGGFYKTDLKSGARRAARPRRPRTQARPARAARVACPPQSPTRQAMHPRRPPRSATLPSFHKLKTFRPQGQTRDSATISARDLQRIDISSFRVEAARLVHGHCAATHKRLHTLRDRRRVSKTTCHNP